MKIKILFSVAIICFFLGISSCADKKVNAEKAYIEACSEGDFDKARGIIEKMSIEKEVSSSDIAKYLKYVNDKEIYFLLAHPSADNDRRIMYLYNAYDQFQLPDMRDVVEVAISQDNENLSMKLIKSGVEPTTEIAKAAVNADFSNLIDVIIKKSPNLVKDNEIKSYYLEAFGKEAYDKLILSEIENELKKIYDMYIPVRPALGRVKSDHYGEIPKEYNGYNLSVATLNSACASLIAIALENGQTAIANKAFNMMRNSLVWNNIGDWCRVVEHEYDHSSVYNTFEVKESSEDKENARKLFNK